MSTKTKEKLTYPRVVGKLTAEEFKSFQAMEAQEEGMNPMEVLFGELPTEIQDARHDFWHALYKAHKLDPQRDYHIDEEEREIVQESAALDPDTI